ncbi:MAG: aminotransferase class V-fold PLP-dependent enzyme [Salibacteraceae bacterium]
MEDAVLIHESYDVDRLREDFPVLEQTVYGKYPLVYLDNGASSQKPKQVVETMEKYYYHHHANIHRGVHYLSQEATTQYEVARDKARDFMNAPHSREVLFTKGTTDGINLVAYSYGRKYLQEGDVVLVSTMEHHSNIVPWQIVCEEIGAKVVPIPINEAGEIDQEAYASMLGPKVRMVAVNHVSNTLGTINPVKDMIALAHQHGIPVLVDGAQSAPHLTIDVQDLDCDFYAISGHKMYGPTGTGILYGKEKWLDAIPPYQGGGEMIQTVTFEKTTYNELPHKFEAGTPNIAGGIALGAAIDYLNSIGLDRIAAHENDLLEYTTKALLEVEGMRIIGTAANKASVISFLIGDIHPYDAGTILDKMGIAVRTGHHCTEPLMNRFEIPGTVRASFGLYNTRAEADRLLEGVHKVVQLFG